MRALELCAGAGGQAMGLEKAGIDTAGLIEIDKDACETLRKNRPEWNVIQRDLKDFESLSIARPDIICGGVPCQPFSRAGKQDGRDDNRDLFPIALKMVSNMKPLAFMFENVRGFAGKEFDSYRTALLNEFIDLGYYVEWRVIECADFGVPQLRPRFVMVGKRNGAVRFPWSKRQPRTATVAGSIADLMGLKGWSGLEEWKSKAQKIAPTIVGGSKKHGGADLGPTQAKRQWAKLGIDGHGITDEPPDRDFKGFPRLTNRMVARLQSFTDEWEFCGRKTSVYRQIGNAFPPLAVEVIAKQFVEWVQVESIEKPMPEPTQLSLISAPQQR